MGGDEPFNPTRPELSNPNIRVGQPVGQIAALKAPWNTERVVVVMEADPTHWPTVSQILQGPLPATQRVVVTSQGKALAGTPGPAPWSVVSWLLEWLASFNLSKLETALIAANLTLVALWRRAIKRLDVALDPEGEQLTDAR